MSVAFTPPCPKRGPTLAIFGFLTVFAVLPAVTNPLETLSKADFPDGAAAEQGSLLPAAAAPAVRPESMPDSVDRVADARERRTPALHAKFAAVGLAYPAREIFLRVFKQEASLELWARDAPGGTPFRLVGAYPVQRVSGRLGPKRREGDGQAPEGIYVIDRFNPRSLFHLSLGLDYPNASDRALTSDPEHPGFDIFIHGGAESAGCLAMGDAAIEEIYLAAADASAAGQTALTVQIFPCRLTPANWEALLAQRCGTQPALAAFWRGLQPAYDIFEQTRRLPLTTILPSGAYLFSPPVASASSDTSRTP